MDTVRRNFENYFQFKTSIKWINVFILAALHIFAIYGIVLLPQTKLKTIIWVLGCVLVAELGLTLGAHRLWSHRSYEAKLPLRIILMLCYVLTGQYSMAKWIKDHRTHHKYSDTDGDPHTASRGLFYSHCGWLMMKKHPVAREKSKGIDISDVLRDPVVEFHQKYFWELFLIVHILFPSSVTYFIIGDSLKNSIFVAYFLRYILILHYIFSQASLLHYWGYQPYNTNTRSVQNKLLSVTYFGEGWHNFHHSFPWDYRIGEFGQGYQLGAHIIEACAFFGLCTNLKSASPALVERVLRKQNLLNNGEINKVNMDTNFDFTY